MSTEHNSLIPMEELEVTVYKEAGVKSIEDVVTHDDTILTFDMYRGKRGDRGIWGRRIFFQSLENLDFIEKEKGVYRPTELANNKYPHFFARVENTWGFSLEAEDEIEEVLHRPLFKVQNELLSLWKEEKREKSRIRREAKKLKERQTQKVKGLF